MEVPTKSRVRFADFVLDLSTGELRSNGDKTYLQQKPFQILTLLLERPGELVTRDQLVKQLWPDGTFVDFDQSLNKAVNRLRQALRDPSDQPKLIETLPRRGYRFIGQIENHAAPTTVLQPFASASTRSWRMNSLAALALALVAIAISFRWFEIARSPSNPLTDLKQRRLTAHSSENAVGSDVISADGKLLAYSDPNGIHIQQIDTGQVRDIGVPESFKGTPQSWVLVNTWIRDGSAIIANATPSGQPPSIWLVPVMGGAMRKIRDDAFAWAASRDGQSVAFGANLGTLYYREVWIMRPDGTDAHKVFDADKDSSFGGVEFSPDGHRLAYIKLRQSPELGEETIESRPLEGGIPATALTVKYPYDIEDWSWSPDGRIIYSLVDYAESSCNFWQVRLNIRTGKPLEKPKRLTNWSGFYLDNPSFSADGKRLTFLKSSAQSTLYLAGLRRSAAQLIAPVHLTLNEGQNDLVGWTHDSKTVIFVSDRSGHTELFEQTAGADTAVRVPSPMQAFGRDHRMSPDGGSILYMVYPTEWGKSQPIGLMRMPIAGGASQLVLKSSIGAEPSLRCARDPATTCILAETSSDHTQLVFTEIDLLRGRGREIARFGIRTTPDAHYSWDLSPDGTHMAILRQSEATITFVTLASNATHSIIVKRSPKLYSLDWSTEGKGLFVSGLANGGSTLLHLDLKGNAQTLWYFEGGLREPGDLFRSGTLAPRAVPSPDGHYLAIQARSVSSNVWMIENF
ncbi:MAG TPA: winged helix-turn-helix domain-containing protein [Terriglobales bacterium]|nr:winged helix-turn-helix domain-containing protein [Terriglobales bacterium]